LKRYLGLATGSRNLKGNDMRRRILLSFGLVILITLGGVAFFLQKGTARELRTFMRRGGMFGAEEMVIQLENYYQHHGSWEGAEGLLLPDTHMMSNAKGMGHGQMGNPDFPMTASFRLADASGSLAFNSENNKSDDPLSSDELQNALQLESNGEVIGYLLPEYGMVIPGWVLEDPLRARLNLASVSAALISGGLALILAILLAYALLKPVTQLTQAATNLAGGDLSQRVQIYGSDELSTLGKAFNHMAASLEKSNEHRQAMTADIAHELRTPLAIQRANLEALQDGVYPLDAAAVATMLEQNQLLTRLVNDLHTLTLADAGELPLLKEACNIAKLIERTKDRFQAAAKAREVQISSKIINDCPALSIDVHRVEQILNNLLDNALRHSPEKGVICIELSCSSEDVEIMITDSGPGIPQEALEHIFERFYRADRARSREMGGSGLGLAIARQLANAHGGSLRAENTKDGGAKFILSLPVASII